MTLSELDRKRRALPVVITKADREAAADYGALTNGHGNDIRSGRYDGHVLVQAFACHRIASQAELLEALQLADALLRGANMNREVVEKKVAAALAKGEGK